LAVVGGCVERGGGVRVRGVLEVVLGGVAVLAPLDDPEPLPLEQLHASPIDRNATNATAPSLRRMLFSTLGMQDDATRDPEDGHSSPRA